MLCRLGPVTGNIRRGRWLLVGARRKLEQILYTCSRYILKCPKSQSKPNYLSFNEGNGKLKILTFKDRRIICTIITILKIIKRKILSDLSSVIDKHRNCSTRSIRNPKLFVINGIDMPANGFITYGFRTHKQVPKHHRY